MGTFPIIILVLGSLFGLSALLALGALFFYWSRKKNRVKELVSGVLAGSSSASMTESRRTSTRILDAEEIKRQSREARQKLQTTEVLNRDSVTFGLASPEEAKFFQAGFYASADKLFYKRFQIVSPIVSTVLGVLLLITIEAPTMLLVVGSILALFIGITLPKSWLERQIEERKDETLRYLPLSIEQISIGVSSSLDLWPCIAHILDMARARDSFNPVTELFIHIERLIVSGLSFPEALQEVGQASGISQIKHAFQFLAQCAEHGGEISKQLQELASSIMTERQTYVEGKIASLPVKATGPLFLVFAGFFALMLAGIFARLVTSLRMS